MDREGVNCVFSVAIAGIRFLWRVSTIKVVVIVGSLPRSRHG
jgi:hypothetical protein